MRPLLATSLATVAGLLLAAVEVRAEPEPGFEDLWKEYKSLASTQDAYENRRRRAITRALGAIRTEESADALLQILKNDHDIRSRVEALRSLGAVAGPQALRKAVIIAAGEEKTVLPLYVGEALARTKDPEVVRWAVEDLLRHANPQIQLGAVEAIGLLSAADACEPLLNLYKRYGDTEAKADLAYEVVRALGRIGGERAGEILLQAAGSKRPHLRLAAAETILLHGRDEKTLAVFRRLLADEDRLVPLFAVRSAGATKEPALVPDLAPLLASPRYRLRAAAHASLSAIVGEDLGASAGEWLTWRKRQENGDKEPEERRTVAAADSKPLVGADRVLLMLDISKSMTAPGWGSRLERGKQELTQVLRSLPEGCRFNVMTVAGYNQLWKKELCEATPRNVASAVSWNEERKYVLCTNTIDGLMEALEQEPPLDAAFWFSDDSLKSVGGNYKEHEEILALVREKNRLKKVEFHTVSLLWGKIIERLRKHEDADDFAEFMRLLAEQSGGTFTEIKGPDTERYRHTRIAWADALPKPPAMMPVAGDPRRKPLLVYIPCDVPSLDQDRLEEAILEDASFALASRFFECVRVSEADARAHPLFDRLQWAPPALVAFCPSRNARKVLRGRPKAASAVSQLAKLAQPDYETDLGETLKKAAALLATFDHIDAQRDALRLKRIGADGAASEKAGKECDDERTRLDELFRKTEDEWKALFDLELKKAAP